MILEQIVLRITTTWTTGGRVDVLLTSPSNIQESGIIIYLKHELGIAAPFS
jgi:hypothetical protein